MEMSRRADGKKFRQALHETKEKGDKSVHTPLDTTIDQ
jgi:hypothetical protein